jgi:hypothetical protein
MCCIVRRVQCVQSGRAQSARHCHYRQHLHTASAVGAAAAVPEAAALLEAATAGGAGREPDKGAPALVPALVFTQPLLEKPQGRGTGPSDAVYPANIVS